MSWPLAFALTLALEGAVLAVLHHREQPAWRIAATLLVANGLTHPVVYLLMPRWFGDYGAYIVVAELFAFLAEIPVLWAGLRPRPWYLAVRSSALANGASYLAGLAINALLLT